jgi:flagellar biosynthesis protein FlhF
MAGGRAARGGAAPARRPAGRVPASTAETGPGTWTPGPAWDLPAEPRAGATRARGGPEEVLLAARRELQDLRVKPRGAPDPVPAAPPMAEDLERMHRVLVRNQVEADIARSILRVFDEQLTLLGEDWTAAQPRFERYLAGLIRTTPGIRLTGAKRPVVAMFIGPTGVGKTTSIAKIASHFALREHRKVALVTADTYRMAATDQLRRFGQILGIPVHVADSPVEMEQIMVRLAGHDLVLVDTAGRSPQHKEHMRQMRELVDAARPDEIHLVMSLTTKYVDILQNVARFGIVPANRVVWTKADETRTYGLILNLSMKFMMDVSYVTTGQEVPDDLEPGDPARLAKLVLGGVGGGDANGRSGRPA